MANGIELGLLTVYNHFSVSLQQPTQVTQAKLEVEKTRRANSLSDKFNALEQLRQKQREDHMQHRRDVMRQEADDMNNMTLKIHHFEKDFKNKVKNRDGRFANSYAPETLRMAAFGG